MPQSNPRDKPAAATSGDWEQRALTIASRLNDAADELRGLIESYRSSPGTTGDGPRPDEEERQADG